MKKKREKYHLSNIIVDATCFTQKLLLELVNKVKTKTKLGLTWTNIHFLNLYVCYIYVCVWRKIDNKVIWIG